VLGYRSDGCLCSIFASRIGTEYIRGWLSIVIPTQSHPALFRPTVEGMTCPLSACGWEASPGSTGLSLPSAETASWEPMTRRAAR
jgi:hypothetical protein